MLDIQNTGNLHLIWIAIDQYEHPHWPTLNNAVSGSCMLEASFQECFGISEIHTISLQNRGASLAEIEKCLRSYGPGQTNELSKNDQLIISFAGHGERDRLTGETAFIPHGGDPESTSTWFRFNHLRPLLQAIEAKHILVISDSCFSGGVFRSGVTTNSADRDNLAYANRVVRMDSRYMISSGGVEPVDDSSGRPGRSVFIEGLLHAINSRTKDWFLADELFIATRNFVVANSHQTPEYGPLSQAGHGGGQLILISMVPIPVELLSNDEMTPIENMPSSIEVPTGTTDNGEREKSKTPHAAKGNLGGYLFPATIFLTVIIGITYLNSPYLLGFMGDEDSIKQNIGSASLIESKTENSADIVPGQESKIATADSLPDQPVSGGKVKRDAEELSLRMKASQPTKIDFQGKKLDASEANSLINFASFSIVPEPGSVSFGLLSPNTKTIILGSYVHPDVLRTGSRTVSIQIGDATGSAPKIIDLNSSNKYDDLSDLKLVQLNDPSEFFVIGAARDKIETAERQGYVSKFDLEGNIIWERLFKSTLRAKSSYADIVINNIFKQKNGDYTIFGDEFVGPFFGNESKSRIFFSRVSHQGKPLISRSSSIYKFENNSATVSIDDKHFLVISEARASLDQSARIRTIKFNDQGKMIAHYRHTGEREVEIADMINMPEEKILALGNHLSGDKIEPAVWKLSAGGDFLKKITVDAAVTFKKLLKSESGKLFAVAKEECGRHRTCTTVYELSNDLQLKKLWSLPPNKDYDRQWLRAEALNNEKLLLVIDDFIFKGSKSFPRLHEVPLD